MAATIQLTSGSALAGSPVVAQVTTEALTVAYSFYRVILQVVASGGGVSITAPLVQNCEAGDTVVFDISSVVRSLYAKVRDAAVTVAGDHSYPVYGVSLTAYANYVSGGVETNTAIATMTDAADLIRGRWYDRDRRGNDTATVSALSRKPTSPAEHVYIGQMLVVPKAGSWGFPDNDLEAPAVTGYVVTAADAAAGTKTINGRTFEVQPYPDDEHVFMQFINSRGVHESIAVLKDPAEGDPIAYMTTDVEREAFDVVPATAFGSVLGHGSRVTANRTRLALQTDCFGREWVDWLRNELLVAEQAWVLVDGRWEPCTIDAGTMTTDTNWRMHFAVVVG